MMKRIKVVVASSVSRTKVMGSILHGSRSRSPIPRPGSCRCDGARLPQFQICVRSHLAQHDDLARVHPEMLYNVVDRFQYCDVIILNLTSREERLGVQTADHFI